MFFCPFSRHPSPLNNQCLLPCQFGLKMSCFAPFTNLIYQSHGSVKRSPWQTCLIRLWFLEIQIPSFVSLFTPQSFFLASSRPKDLADFQVWSTNPTLKTLFILLPAGWSASQTPVIAAIITRISKETYISAHYRFHGTVPLMVKASPWVYERGCRDWKSPCLRSWTGHSGNLCPRMAEKNRQLPKATCRPDRSRNRITSWNF